MTAMPPPLINVAPCGRTTATDDPRVLWIARERFALARDVTPPAPDAREGR